MEGGGDIISGNEQYLSVRRIRCFVFAFWTWRTITVALCPLFPPVNNAVIGHSMSKGIKKRQPSFHRLLLAVAFNYFN